MFIICPGHVFLQIGIGSTYRFAITKRTITSFSSSNYTGALHCFLIERSYMVPFWFPVVSVWFHCVYFFVWTYLFSLIFLDVLRLLVMVLFSLRTDSIHVLYYLQIAGKIICKGMCRQSLIGNSSIYTYKMLQLQIYNAGFFFLDYIHLG